ncbi:MAG: hypothetical protein Q7T55_10620, partial [Solirubrobacteraceae bacterium]|nr:hypothetical protein [Solirubrobacteraceae bacterium]
MPSPRSYLAVAALVLLAAFDASTAAAARLDVSRRVDPSLDGYLFTPLAKTPISSMSADQRWISSHASPLVVHDSDPRVSQYLTGWATKPKLAAYVNGTGVHPSHTVEMEQAKDWFVSAGGAPVFVDGWRTLDLRIPAARKWWLYGTDGKATCNADIDQRAALDLYACGYKSLWIDNALTTPKQGLTPTPDIPEKAWASGVLTLLSQLRQLKPKSTTFTINMHWTDTDFGYSTKPKIRASAPAIRAGRYADQVIIEGGAIDRGLHYALAAKQPWSYRR